MATSSRSAWTAVQDQPGYRVKPFLPKRETERGGREEERGRKKGRGGNGEEGWRRKRRREREGREKVGRKASRNDIKLEHSKGEVLESVQPLPCWASGLSNPLSTNSSLPGHLLSVLSRSQEVPNNPKAQPALNRQSCGSANPGSGQVAWAAGSWGGGGARCLSQGWSMDFPICIRLASGQRTS